MPCFVGIFIYVLYIGIKYSARTLYYKATDTIYVHAFGMATLMSIQNEVKWSFFISNNLFIKLRHGEEGVRRGSQGDPGQRQE